MDTDVAMEGFTGPTLNAEQARAVQLLEAGRNVFLTGVAGTGKTYALNAWLRRKNRGRYAVTASTGIAATHLDGCTIHSWVGCGIANRKAKDIAKRWWWQNNVGPVIALTDTLVIDEISMLDGITFELVAELVRIARQEKDDPRPFGSLQVVLVGDMGQLSPVEEEDRGFAFETDAWWDSQLEIVNLERVMRQDDAQFVSVLQQVREGRLGQDGYQLLNSRVGAYNPDLENAVRLTTHNRLVDKTNAARLAQIDAEERVFPAVDSGRDMRALEKLDKRCLSPKVLRLKVGARVMATKNDPGLLYANGSLGYVEGFSQDEWSGDEFIHVRFDGCQRPTRIPRKEWKNTRMEKRETNGVSRVQEVTVARRVQFPLRLAWAMTVHKSQGMTLSKVSVDLANCFAPGQAYVALSRARSLDGLNIERWRGGNSIEAHPTVGAFNRGEYRLPAAEGSTLDMTF